jgi:hypothetical protein
LRPRCVALVTRDPALYAELAGALRERHTPTLSLLPGQRIPDRAAVVLTSPSEVALIHHPAILAVRQDGDLEALWAAVESALASEGASGELVIGFDPGPRPGYAVLSGRRVLVRGNLESPEEAGRLGTHIRHRFPGRSLRFRVGSGDRFARTRILNSLLPLRRPVEIVDEKSTTPRGPRGPRDAVAASRIAQTPGRTAHDPAPLKATAGEIANLQRLSREGSRGQFTITRAQASRVLQGEITFGDALADGERRYGLSRPAHRGLSENARRESS